MPNDCHTECPPLDEEVSALSLTVTSSGGESEDCIQRLTKDESLGDPTIPVTYEDSGDTISQLTDGSAGSELTVGNSNNNSPQSVSNVLSNPAGKLTVFSPTFQRGDLRTIVDQQSGLTGKPGPLPAILLPDSIPNYSDIVFNYQGVEILFSSPNVSVLGAKRIVRSCNGVEDCNIELRKINIEVNPFIISAPPPLFTNPTCEGLQAEEPIDASDVSYSDTILYEYTITGNVESGSSVEVTVSLTDLGVSMGYTLTGATEWVHHFPNEEDLNCPTLVSAEAPSFTDPNCDGLMSDPVIDDSDVSYTDTEVYEYNVFGTVSNGQTVTVTVSLTEYGENNNFQLIGQSEWVHHFPDVEELSCECPYPDEVWNNFRGSSATCINKANVTEIFGSASAYVTEEGTVTVRWKTDLEIDVKIESYIFAGPVLDERIVSGPGEGEYSFEYSGEVPRTISVRGIMDSGSFIDGYFYVEAWSPTEDVNLPHFVNEFYTYPGSGTKSFSVPIPVLRPDCKGVLNVFGSDDYLYDVSISTLDEVQLSVVGDRLPESPSKLYYFDVLSSIPCESILHITTTYDPVGSIDIARLSFSVSFDCNF